MLLGLGVAALLVLSAGRETISAISYSVDEFYLNEPACPGWTAPIEYEVSSDIGGVFHNYRLVVDEATGRNMIAEPPIYRWLDKGETVATAFDFVIPDLPPGSYELINISVSQFSPARSDHFRVHFSIREDCNE
jgi:hypothetical protein